MLLGEHILRSCSIAERSSLEEGKNVQSLLGQKVQAPPQTQLGTVPALHICIWPKQAARQPGSAWGV